MSISRDQALRDLERALRALSGHGAFSGAVARQTFDFIGNLVHSDLDSPGLPTVRDLGPGVPYQSAQHHTQQGGYLGPANTDGQLAITTGRRNEVTHARVPEWLDSPRPQASYYVDHQALPYQLSYNPPMLARTSAVLRKVVFCPWKATFENRHTGNSGCHAAGSHGYFTHDRSLGLREEKLECPFWIEGRCERLSRDCQFAHYWTTHGQVQQKP